MTCPLDAVPGDPVDSDRWWLDDMDESSEEEAA